MVQGHSFDQIDWLSGTSMEYGICAGMGYIRWYTGHQLSNWSGTFSRKTVPQSCSQARPTTYKYKRAEDQREKKRNPAEVEGVHGGSRQTDAASINCHSLSCQPFSRICRRCLAFGFYCDTVGFMSATVLVCFENFDDARLG